MAIKIGISGKRRIKVHEKKIVAQKIKQAINTLLEKHEEPQFIGYTSLAIGADTIFAEVVRDVFKQPLYVILPFDRTEYEKDFEEPDDVNTLHSELNQAQQIDTIAAKIPSNPEERNEAYFAAGKYIVDHCDEMLFVWDELMPEGRGGTAELIGYYCEVKTTY